MNLLFINYLLSEFEDKSFKNQEVQVIETTKTVENFLEQCKECETMYETNFEKPFNRDIISKPAHSKISIVPNQRIVTQNHSYLLSLENLIHIF